MTTLGARIGSGTEETKELKVDKEGMEAAEGVQRDRDRTATPGLNTEGVAEIAGIQY